MFQWNFSLYKNSLTKTNFYLPTSSLNKSKIEIRYKLPLRHFNGIQLSNYFLSWCLIWICRYNHTVVYSSFGTYSLKSFRHTLLCTASIFHQVYRSENAQSGSFSIFSPSIVSLSPSLYSLLSLCMIVLQVDYTLYYVHVSLKYFMAVMNLGY